MAKDGKFFFAINDTKKGSKKGTILEVIFMANFGLLFFCHR
jgi:hypothetical protein